MPEARRDGRDDAGRPTSSPEETSGPDPRGRRSAEWLAASLPEYMVPATFVTLDALPLTPNGKVDRNALPDPRHGPGGFGRPVPSPPEGLIEEAIAGVWAETLGVRHVGVHDNFFELGGHSLMAIQLIARMRHTFGVEAVR